MKPCPFVVVLALVGMNACGGSNSPTSPTPTPTPRPATFTLSGTVTDRATGQGIGGASVVVTDGPNANKLAVTDGSGHYSVANLIPGGFTARASKTYYQPQSLPETLTADATLDFALEPIPPWTMAGTGDTVFDMPTNITRVFITADYGGFAQNFIVHIGNDFVVNELMGTGFNQTHFEGTYLTNGGVVEILSSSGVAWRFAEVR